MLLDLQSEALPAALEAEVCVIGSGPVGITLALELSRRGVPVLLVESGGRTVEPEVQDLVRCRNVGRNHNGSNLGRYRVFGGTSTKWGGQLLPLSPIDFEARDWVENSGWPIDHDELGPYYGRALEFGGLRDCLVDDLRVWQAIDVRPPDLGPGIGLHFSRWCPWPDFAQLHGAEIESAGGIRCVLHATVTRFACAGERITSAVARSLEGKEIRILARQFVVCVGAVETARLLLQPLENGDSAPWVQRSDAIGRFFQDHPTFECADVKPRNEAAFHHILDMVYLGKVKYQPRIFLSAERQRDLRSLNAGGLVKFKTEISAEVLHQVRVAARRLRSGPFSLGVLAVALRNATRAGPLILKQAWRYFAHHRAFNPSDLGCRLLAFVEQMPDPASRISLSDERDALGMQRVKVDWRISQSEIDAVHHFALSVKEAFESAGFADVQVDRQIADRAPSATDLCWDNFHDLGTARMASGPASGVVDRDLRIFGAENGWVCGHAVFPTGGFANPTFTTMALAVRLADRLAGLSAR